MPGDIGGQFAPKDEAAATQTLHDGIAAASSGSGSATQATPVPTSSVTSTQPTPKNPGAPSDGSEDRIDESYGLDGVIVALSVLGVAAAGGASEAIAAVQDVIAAMRNIDAVAQFLPPPDASAGSSPAATTAAPAASTAAATGEITTASATEVSYDWTLGDFKSAQRWENQMNSREWTLEDIDNTIQNGVQSRAPYNNINKGNTATVYTDPVTGKYVVRDDITNEIIQISKKNFKL